MKDQPITPLPEVVAMLNEAIFDLDEQTCAPKVLRMLLVSAARKIEAANHITETPLHIAEGNPVREAMHFLIRAMSNEMPESVRKQVSEVQLRLFVYV